MKTIPLTRGKVAVVDDADYAKVSTAKWSANPTQTPGKFYAALKSNGGNGKNTTVYMHRLIVDAKPGEEVDHKNNDGLNNQRSNLRVCTRTQNEWNKGLGRNNKSGYFGVYRGPTFQRWRSQVIVGRKLISFGYYDTAEEAARAYDARIKEFRGPFAVLNFPDGEPSRRGPPPISSRTPSIRRVARGVEVCAGGRREGNDLL